MRMYECPEDGCDNIVEAKIYPRCGYHTKNNGMYEVLAWGGSKSKIKTGKGIGGVEFSISGDSLNDSAENGSLVVHTSTEA